MHNVRKCKEARRSMQHQQNQYDLPGALQKGKDCPMRGSVQRMKEMCRSMWRSDTLGRGPRISHRKQKGPWPERRERSCSWISQLPAQPHGFGAPSEHCAGIFALQLNAQRAQPHQQRTCRPGKRWPRLGPSRHGGQHPAPHAYG